MTTFSAAVAQSAVPAPTRSVKRVVGASLAGTTLEFYDHFIYGSAAALVFPKLFFSQASPLTAMLLSLASYGVAFVARPFGAALFGHFGDRLGRKWVLVVTLLLMGLSTFAIGLLPSAAAAGVLAPVLLVLLRILQGLALGGEWGGAALMVNEFDPTGRRRGFYGSLVQLAAPIGLLLANGVFAGVTWWLSEDAFLSWGWRIPFLSSALLIAVGLYIRMGLAESPLFEKMEKEGQQGHAPIVEVLRHHKKEVGLALGSRIGSDIAFYVFTLFLLVYLPQQLQLPKSIGLQAVLVGALAQCIGIPLFGHLSDKVGRRPVLLFGAVAGIVWSFAFFALVDTKSTALILLAAFVAMFIVAAMFSPLASYIPEMFPTQVRCTGSSLGFQLAGIFGGAPAPLIVVPLVAAFGSSLPVSIYLAATLLLIVVCVLAAPETAHKNLER
ncbi:MHS family MFS transporter [Variovorax paradoxus]|nr:MHS family MFS transporter [Variovorax paradoxus]